MEEELSFIAIAFLLEASLTGKLPTCRQLAYNKYLTNKQTLHRHQSYPTFSSINGAWPYIFRTEGFNKVTQLWQ